MAIRKRAAAVVATTTQGSATPTTTTQGSATPCKRSRSSIGSTDEYEKVACLGKGGFGIVFKARHRATGKTVAIKFLSSTEEDPDVPELLPEARFLEVCSGNAYVVGFEGLVRDHTAGKLCVVMEFVDAPSLHAFLWERRRGPPLPESKVRAFMWTLLTETKAMHDRHVVHRDIKPANILIGQDGDLVKICDLGLAIC